METVYIVLAGFAVLVVFYAGFVNRDLSRLEADVRSLRRDLDDVCRGLAELRPIDFK